MPVYETTSTTTAAIANGATTSGAVSLEGVTILGIIMPATFTGTALTFQVCDTSGGTYVALYDSTNAAVSVTVGTSRAYYLDPAIFAAWRFVKVVSGSTEGGARSITLLTRPV